MEEYYDKAKKGFKAKGFKKTFKIIGFFFIGLLFLILVSVISLRIYFDAQLVPKNDLMFFKSNVKLNDGNISNFLLRLIISV